MMELHTSNNVTLDGRYVGRINWNKCVRRYDSDRCYNCNSANLSKLGDPYRVCNDCDYYLPLVKTVFVYRKDFFNKNSAEFTFNIHEPIYVGKGSNWKINPRLEAAVRQIVENDGAPL